MKEDGEKINLMVLGYSNGEMGIFTKGILKMDSSMVMESINGLMDHPMMENGKKEKYLVLVFISILMAEFMKEVGSII